MCAYKRVRFLLNLKREEERKKSLLSQRAVADFYLACDKQQSVVRVEKKDRKKSVSVSENSWETGHPESSRYTTANNHTDIWHNAHTLALMHTCGHTHTQGQPACIILMKTSCFTSITSILCSFSLDLHSFHQPLFHLSSRAPCVLSHLSSNPLFQLIHPFNRACVCVGWAMCSSSDERTSSVSPANQKAAGLFPTPLPNDSSWDIGGGLWSSLWCTDKCWQMIHSQ